MPFIDTRLNVSLSKEKETAIKAKLGEAIEVFPGKNEYWLMISFEDNCRMWFRGHDDVSMAMVQIELFGTPDPASCEEMTKKVCCIFKEELGIPADRVYVKYAFTETWGWNNENF